jgi:hypothetical protein
MANTDQMRQRVQRLVGNHSLATNDLVLGFLNNRHSDLLESFDWSRKKQEIGITLQVDKTGGTLTVVNSSPTVNGVGTAFTASDVGRYIQIGADQSSQFVVKTVTLGTQFTLGDLNGSTIAYPGTSASGINYVMYTRHYSLGLGIESIVAPIKGYYPIDETTEGWLDDKDPTRSGIASYPNLFCRSPRNMTGTNDLARIEFYPRVSQAQVVNVPVLKGHTDLLPNQYPIVPSGPLEWFAAQDVALMLLLRTKDQIWAVAADKFEMQGEKSLEREKSLDNKKFGQSDKVKDVQSGTGLEGTDFSITHDLGG